MTRRTRLTLFWTALAVSIGMTMSGAYLQWHAPGALMAGGVWAGIVVMLAVMIDDGQD